jgi:hypothetical protein
MVWVGENNASRRYEAKVRLFMSTLENPRPDKQVVSIDFVSSRSVYGPFLVALTAEP